MSYILDALKRAESERDRGAVPGLLSQHGASRRDPAQTHSSTPTWLFAGAAVILLLLGAGLWRWLAPTTLHNLPPAAPSVLAASTAPPLQTSVPSASAAPQTPAATVTTPAPLADQSTQPLSRAAVMPVRIAAPAATTTAAAAPTKSTPQTIAAPVATISPVAPAAPTPAAPGPAPTPKDNNNVPMLSDLPPNLRSQIAAINIAGTVYSESAAQRLLLTETGVFSPGSTVVPGVVLEEIHADGAIFNFHGTRFQINH